MQYCNKWQMFKRQFGEQPVNEKQLFHYSHRNLKDIIKSNQGFDPRHGKGEYGQGVYFAEHAQYSVAYAEGWLGGAEDDEPAGSIQAELTRKEQANTPITLFLARVLLGKCKDFEGRCASERCVGEKISHNWGGEWPSHSGFKPDWTVPPPIPNGEETPGVVRRYDSVTGTEGDMKWAVLPRLNGEPENGRQYVVYEQHQAYPEFVVELRRSG